jgi:hypothetical protein
MLGKYTFLFKTKKTKSKSTPLSIKALLAHFLRFFEYFLSLCKMYWSVFNRLKRLLKNNYLYLKSTYDVSQFYLFVSQ